MKSRLYFNLEFVFECFYSFLIKLFKTEALEKKMIEDKIEKWTTGLRPPVQKQNHNRTQPFLNLSKPNSVLYIPMPTKMLAGKVRFKTYFCLELELIGLA